MIYFLTNLRQNNAEDIEFYWVNVLSEVVTNAKFCFEFYITKNKFLQKFLNKKFYWVKKEIMIFCHLITTPTTL